MEWAGFTDVRYYIKTIVDPERYDHEVRMHAEMRMNMIRVWGGGLTERPEFYEACDKYGILVRVLNVAAN